MGLFWDKLKAVFKKKGNVVDAANWKTEFSGELPEDWERQIYKQSTAPAVLVAVGFGKEYDNKLAIRKSKSQSRNWRKWKRHI